MWLDKDGIDDGKSEAESSTVTVGDELGTNVVTEVGVRDGASEDMEVDVSEEDGAPDRLLLK